MANKDEVLEFWSVYLEHLKKGEEEECINALMPIADVLRHKALYCKERDCAEIVHTYIFDVLRSIQELELKK